MREIRKEKLTTRIRSQIEDNSKRIIVVKIEFCAKYLSFMRFWQAKNTNNPLPLVETFPAQKRGGVTQFHRETAQI
jgi:hypothetical protein